LNVDALLEATDKLGQFDVLVDGQLIAARGGNPVTRILLGAGFPDLGHVVDDLARRRP
jgi:hypothetical protein